MNVAMAIGVASAVGAALFFTGGHLLHAARYAKALADLHRRLRHANAERAVAEDEGARRFADERARLERDLAEARAASSLAREQLERARTAASTAAAQMSELEAAVGARKAERDVLEHERDELKRRLARAEQERAALVEERAHVHRERQHLQLQVGELQRALGAEVTGHDGTPDQVAADALAAARNEAREAKLNLHLVETRAAAGDALREELAELRQTLSDVRASSVPREEAELLRRQHRELLLKAQLMDKRVEVLTRHAEENAVLRQRLSQLESAEANARELAHRVRELEAQVLAAGITATASALGGARRPATAALAVAPEDAAASGAGAASMGATMDEHLAALVRHGRASVAVLADSRGLMLAASGEHRYQEALAAVAGLIQHTAARAAEMLPLGDPWLVEIGDSNAVGLRCRLFPWESELLSVTVLGVHQTAPDTVFEAVVSSLSGVVAASR